MSVSQQELHRKSTELRKFVFLTGMSMLEMELRKSFTMTLQSCTCLFTDLTKANFTQVRLELTQELEKELARVTISTFLLMWRKTKSQLLVIETISSPVNKSFSR